MPPRLMSRYMFARAVPDEDDVVSLYGEEPFRYRDLPDNRLHPVRQGDSLQSIAALAWPKLPRPEGLWWVLADFQPEPIHDPTLELSIGRVIVVPSERTVTEDILGERRRRSVQ